MHFSTSALAALAIAFVQRVAGVAPTDSYRDADTAQSGYLPNHNMDPAVVDSSQFGQLWKVQFNSLEQFYAKPLVYTPSTGGPQLLFLASTQNYIRTLNAKTGEVINTRRLHNPFLQSDISCTDIANTIGIIGTPVIDPATDVAYFFAKSYIPNYRTAGNTGTYNGVYYFHGVDIKTLQDVPGFPILVDGAVADNDPRKYFVGGIVLQRPSLVQIGSVVYGAFGGHCDLFNYTGAVIGVDVNTKKVVSQFVTESGPLVPQTNNWNENGGGGQAGIWMAGMGLSSDGNRLFFVTGNGVGHENNGIPALGSSGCKTLGEAAVSLQIGDGGSLALADYFQPYDYANMDAGDQDFGSGGVTLLDPSVFNGAGVPKMAVSAGKNGKIYIMNANSLGGYKNGPGQTDGIIQTIATNKAVFGGCGSYPLEGGYIYSTPIGFPTYVYKLGSSSSGVPIFTQVGQTKETSAGRVGSGIPTVTSNQGKPGTAILWLTDPDAGLRAWYAVPGSDGFLKAINLPQVNGLNKFQRPTFGDSRLYVSDSNGLVYCLGSPVNLPLNCTSPVSFGNLALGSSANQTVTCKANIAVTSINGATVGDLHFIVDNATLPQGPLAAGTVFSFPVTWDLRNTTLKSTPNATYGNISPGVKSTALTLYTTNGVTGYSTVFPIGLTGVEVSQKAYLTVAPITVDYGGIVVTNGSDAPTVSRPFVISNAGLSPMTILGYAYQNSTGGPFTNVTKNSAGVYDLGLGFTSANLPAVGSILQNGTSISVDTVFSPVTGVGSYASYLYTWSNGGSSENTLVGSASTAPKANFSISTSEGGWLPGGNLVMDFGKVAPTSSSSLKIRICNEGGSVLSISKSKPPNGVFHIDDPAQLHEAQQILVGDCAYGVVLYNPLPTEYNHADIFNNNSWTLNTNDLTFGVHVVQIQGTAISHKVGPSNSTGQAVYTYLGCYRDNTNGKLLSNAPYAGPNTTNGYCQNLCVKNGYVFAGSEYQNECYCGNKPPPSSLLDPNDVSCTYQCAGDQADFCGGFGGYISVYYDATKYTPGNDTVAATTGGPITVPSATGYNSIGCYSEGTNGRALADKAPQAPVNGSTIESCAAGCVGFTYFGVEFGNECYCGNTLGTGSVAQPSTDPATNGCSMLCNGNSTEYCGGPNRLNMYQLNGTVSTPTTSAGATPTATVTGLASATATPTGPFTVGNFNGWNYLGCYSDSTNSRALTDLQNPIPGASNSVEACAQACASYGYFGVEYSGECYCGKTINAGSALVAGSTPGQTGCNMLCNANRTEYCGGPNRLNMYQAAPVFSNSTTNATATVVASSTVPATTTAAPTPTGPITVTNLAGYNYLGCYSEGSAGRALIDVQNPYPGANNTVERCAAACSKYTYFGVEYSGECYCGNTIQAGSALVAGNTPGATQCNMICSANSTEYCGGPNRLNMYKVNIVTTTTTTTPLAASTTAATSGFASNSANATIPASATAGGATASGSIINYANATTFGSSTAAPATASGSIINSVNSTTPAVSTATATTATPASNSIVNSVNATIFATTASGTIVNSANATVPASSTAPSATASGSIVNSVNATIFATTASGTIVNSANATIPASSTAPATTASGSITNSANATIPTSTPAATTVIGSTTAAASTTTPATTTPAPQTTTIPATTTTPLTTTTSTTTSAQTYLPTPGQTTNSWAYLGCANETNPRALSAATYANSTAMTLESCQAFCTKNNYGLAGLEFGQECFCGNGLGSYSTIGQTGCSMPCSGNSSEICGGPSRISVFNNTLYVPPTTVRATAGYVAKGCYNEVQGRLLSGPSYVNATGMSVESCVSFCSSASPSMPYAGVEYGQECYCAATLPTAATSVDPAKCNMLCSGDKREFCGAGGLIGVYHYEPTAASSSVNVANSATVVPNTSMPAASSPSATAVAGTTTPAAGVATTTAVAAATTPVVSTVPRLRFRR